MEFSPIRHDIDGIVKDCSILLMHWRYCSLVPSHQYVSNSLCMKEACGNSNIDGYPKLYSEKYRNGFCADWERNAANRIITWLQCHMLWTCVLWVIKDRFKGSLIRPFALGSSKNPTVPDLIDYLLGPGGSELFDENLIQRGNTPQMCFSHGYGFTSAFLLTWNTTTPTWINDHPITPRDPLNISTD